LSKTIRYYMGLIMIGYGLAQIPIIMVSLIYGEIYHIYYLASTSILLITGLLLVRFAEKPVEIALVDPLIIAVISFLIPGLTNTIVMIVTGFDPWDSLFESISSITTTGLSLYSPNKLPYTIHFARAWLQWIGGVGIVILTLGTLLKPGTVAYKLLATHIRKEAVMPSVMVVARAVLCIYGLLTLISIIAYYLTGMSLFDAVIHGLTTISTGGFSTQETFPRNALWIAIVFMFLSAQSFSRFYMTFFKRRPRYLGMGPQIKSFIIINLIAIVLSYIAVNMFGSTIDFGDIAFNILSASTTTGYTTISVDELPTVVKYIIIVLMIIGASLGSTGGGLKQYRFIILLKETWRRLLKMVSPHGRLIVVKINGEVIDDEEVYNNMLIISLYILSLTISTIIFLYTGYSLEDSLFTVASALGTVGLAPSIVNHTLPWWSKLLLSMDMFIGRLEILPVASILPYVFDKMRGK